MPAVIALAAAAAFGDPAGLTQLRPHRSALAAGRLEIVANGPLAVREFRLARPARLVIEFDGARVVGEPWRVGPGAGGPIRAGGLYQVGPDLARAVFMLDDPASLAWRAEPLGPRFTRIVVGPAAEAVPAVEPAARIEAIACQGGRLEVRGTRPLVARVAALPGGPGYLLEFAGTRLTAGLAGLSIVPAGGEVRRVRALAPERVGGPARLAIELASQLPYRRLIGGDAWAWGPAAQTLLARLPLPVRRPPPPIGWRPAGAVAAGWRSGSHFLLTSNVAQFGPGSLAAGTRHRFGGHFVQAAPLLAGTLVGHLDAQVLRFGEPRFDYVSTLGSLALAHALRPRVHLFEGAAGLQRKEAYASTISQLDGSLFAGAGIWGALPGGGHWAASLVVDRVSASEVRRAYYGQALRLRGQLPLGRELLFTAQATLQRLDPLVRSQAFFREYVDLGGEWAFMPAGRLGLLAQAGFQQRGGAEAYLLGGPSLSLLF